MGSARLAGKVLLDVVGRPMLAHQVRRLRQATTVDEVVLATTPSEGDRALVQFAKDEGLRWFCGSEQDVLARFVGAAREAEADVVVRVTGDCPLLDPEVLDRVVRELTDHAAECDYASNVGLTSRWEAGGGTKPLDRTFPRGLDVEVLFADVLYRIDRLANTPEAREHVTVLPRSARPELFLTRTVHDAVDNSDLRWTVDTPTDLEVIRTIYRDLGLAERVAPYSEVLEFVRARPELARSNADVVTTTG